MSKLESIAFIILILCVVAVAIKKPSNETVKKSELEKPKPKKETSDILDGYSEEQLRIIKKALRNLREVHQQAGIDLSVHSTDEVEND